MCTLHCFSEGTNEEIVKILWKEKRLRLIKVQEMMKHYFMYHVKEEWINQIVQILIDRDDYKVDINQPNSNNYTPVYIAACFNHP